MNTADYLLLAGKQDDVVLTGSAGSATYGALRDLAAKVCAGLAELGLPAGARVGLVAGNSPFWVAAYLATLKLDLVAVPLSPTLKADELAARVDWAGCSAMLVDRRGERAVRPVLAGTVPILAEDATRAAAQRHWPTSSSDPDADAVLMFTSGTQGRPRAVRVTHRNIQANTESIIAYLGLSSDDRMLVVLPFFYCFGASLLHTHLRVGASLALCNTFAFPQTAVDMVDREACTGLAGVPSTFQMLWRTSFPARQLPTLRMIQQAGGRIAPALLRDLVSAKPDARVFVMYGQTEATARLSYLPPELASSKPGSVGRGIPGVRLEVVDELGDPVSPGQRGEVFARGENISPGYFNDPQATAERFRDGGLRTGDMATVDEEGYIYLLDRKEDFIKTLGHRFSSRDVESRAEEMSQVAAAAAIGVPDAQLGEAVVLFVIAKEGSTVSPEDVIAFCRPRMARQMVPRCVHVVKAFPLTDSGKVAKPQLRAMVGAGGVNEEGS